MRPSATDRRRLRELGPRGLVHLGVAALTLPLLRGLIAGFGVRRTASLVRRVAILSRPLAWRGRQTPADVLHRRIAIAGRRGPVEATCLPQSMLLWAWLRAGGDEPTLRIGIGDGGALLRAHAWVELGDQQFGRGDESAFDGFDLMAPTA